MSEKFTANIVCRSCNGTGLYQGMAERDGAAVVCHTCKGSGCEKYSMKYELFTERKTSKKFKRVFATSCGYVHSSEDVVLKDEGKTIRFSEGGVAYNDWLKGQKPAPVKDLYCPYLWTGQEMQSRDHSHHAMYESTCNKVLSIGGSITKCKNYEDKGKCWKLYEAIGKDWE